MDTVTSNFYIRELDRGDLPVAIEFVMEIRREVYPMLPYEPPKDMVHFDEVYFRSKDASFVAAFDAEGRIAATAAFLRYDDRIKEIKGLYHHQMTAELVKCYVRPELKKQGIGTAMVREILSLAQAKGYETMYLHTHRFLPGAVRFWEKQGFCIRLESMDSYETVHMDKTFS